MNCVTIAVVVALQSDMPNEYRWTLRQVRHQESAWVVEHGMLSGGRLGLPGTPVWRLVADEDEGLAGGACRLVMRELAAYEEARHMAAASRARAEIRRHLKELKATYMSGDPTLPFRRQLEALRSLIALQESAPRECEELNVPPTEQLLVVVDDMERGLAQIQQHLKRARRTSPD